MKEYKSYQTKIENDKKEKPKVIARQCEEKEVVGTKKGRIVAKKGDYITFAESGNSVVSKQAFESTFEINTEMETRGKKEAKKKK